MERFKENEILFDVEEAMEYLHVSRSTIYRLIKRGELKGHKVGKKWVFYKRNLRDFLERKAYRPEGEVNFEFE
ncbi:MAG: helix-turn-helix domain-containing protein [Chloroflexi bacterium]|nr:helix-turn-helix domain-containing protein [Chloroflexota bacterium]